VLLGCEGTEGFVQYSNIFIDINCRPFILYCQLAHTLLPENGKFQISFVLTKGKVREMKQGKVVWKNF
jgi:hypothetical protein